MIKFVYCIYEECHGLVGIWTDEAKARAEVDRLSKFYEDIEENAYFCDKWNYGNDMVQYEKVRVNVEW